MTRSSSEVVKLETACLEVRRRGAGRPLLVLPGEEELEFDSPAFDILSKDHELIVVSPPGFGRSDRPDWITNADDMSYAVMDLVRRLGLASIPVIGFSLGGWIAAEMAVKDDSFMSKLVLVDSYGVKLGGPYDRDIADFWLLHPTKVAELKWRDVEKGKRDFSTWSDDDLAIVARNTESFARFCWEPFMHNPKLKHLLHRIRVPSLLIWGQDDGVTPASYGEGFAQLIPGAKFRAIGHAGHYPHVEQPEAFLKELRSFLG